MALGEPTTGTTERMGEVARLRVEGVSWRDIAAKYGYENENSAQHMMTQEHKAEWRKIYEDMRALLLDDVEGEATLVGRKLLRSQSEDIQQRAVGTLLNHCSKLRAQKVEVQGVAGGIPIAIVLDAADVDNGRPHSQDPA